ncbi:hypothetical protein D3P07_03395 [Paenibacillus sp. 1011MAR3C5]|uniref:hypothetical protein n=1 Tax=Paenibacillus sp. 1011MAR3C5 TaxID=1675787 RepID=UPI000E6C9698|nr:hypothetical protein [Paenibacillus sp. 1011MAR3C5]RJE91128.1 hypothetical protein D3P07_03395 [Paenibacillus sp. 1011MAR3C5]
MYIMIAAGLAIVSVALAAAGGKYEKAKRGLDGLACLAAFVFFVAVSGAVLKTLLDDTVFMTEVHSVLLNPAFLISGAYLGPYGVSRLALLAAWRGK